MAEKVLDQELGATIGVELGGRTSPGGLNIGGHHLYRLATLDWLETSVAFTFGGDRPQCFRDRRDEVICDHGQLSGAALEAALGIRHLFGPAGSFTPFVTGGLALRLVSFAADDVRGAALPLYLGGGIRAGVAERVSLVGGATTRSGFGVFGRGLGLEPQWGLEIFAGAEFALK